MAQHAKNDSGDKLIFNHNSVISRMTWVELQTEHAK